MAFGKFIQGLAGNFSEQKQRNSYQKNMDNIYQKNEENSKVDIKLIRDSIIFTNIRIIFTDKQGATGRKMSIKSIFLMNIVNV